MSEIAFEQFGLALENPRNTAVGAPTHMLFLPGSISPREEKYRPDEMRGSLVKNYRSKVVRRWSEWEAEGALDYNTLPLLCAMALRGGVTPTQPTGATLTNIWTHRPNLLADDLRSATMFWGDPNVTFWQAPFGMIDTFTIAGDMGGTDGVTTSVGGMANPMVPMVSVPTLPATVAGDILVPASMKVFLDTTATIGTTQIADRLVSAEHSFPVGLAPKFTSGAGGATASLGYNRVGRNKRQAEATFAFEYLSRDQYDLWANAEVVKSRTIYEGPIIETYGAGVTQRCRIVIDVYGTFDAPSWGELEGTNRTIELPLVSEYNSVAGHDWSVVVQNGRSTL